MLGFMSFIGRLKQYGGIGGLCICVAGLSFFSVVGLSVICSLIYSFIYSFLLFLYHLNIFRIYNLIFV